MRQLVLFYLSVLACGALAGEVALEENFEKIKLDKLSAGLSVFGKSNDAVISVEDKKDQGKVLKVQIKKAAAPAVGLLFPLPHTRMAGKEIRCTIKALFPGKYEATKTVWQRPRVVVTAIQEDGKPWYFVPPYPDPEKKDWQTLSGKATVPEKIKSLTIDLQTVAVVSEVWFDDLVVEINPGATPPPPAKSGNMPQRTSDEIADETPSKTLDEAKINISPHGAKYVLKFLKAGLKGNDPKKVLLVGPGVGTGKERYLPKSSEYRAFIVGPPAVTAPTLDGVGLLAALPDVLAEVRPGYVLLVGVKGRKKVENDDNFDWNDVCLVCLRYGAVPLLGLPDTPEADDAMRALFRTMAVNAAWPAVDLGTEVSADLVSSMLKLMDQYVVQVPGTGASAAKKPDAVLDE